MKQEQVIKSGIKEWNEWVRSKNEANNYHSIFRPNFVKADLRNFDFRGANLHRPNFYKAKLDGAIFDDLKIKYSNFKEAECKGASFQNTNLCNSILSSGNFENSSFHNTAFVSTALNETIFDNSIFEKAEFNISRMQRTSFKKCEFKDCAFFGAEIKEATFEGSVIHKSDIRQAYLVRSNFNSVDFNSSRFGQTILSQSSFKNAKKLSTVNHEGPSTVDLRTISTIGSNKVSFLRGLGLSEIFIDYLDSLLSNPFEFYNCFISYSTENEELATRLYNDLNAKGIRCWKWDIDGKWGRPLNAEIDKAIKVYDKLILICSKESLNSRPVLREVDRAIQKENENPYKHVIFPIRIDDFILDEWENYRKPDIVDRIIGDFSEWKNHEKYQALLNKLIASLKK